MSLGGWGVQSRAVYDTTPTPSVQRAVAMTEALWAEATEAVATSAISVVASPASNLTGSANRRRGLGRVIRALARRRRGVRPSRTIGCPYPSSKAQLRTTVATAADRRKRLTPARGGLAFQRSLVSKPHLDDRPGWIN